MATKPLDKLKDETDTYDPTQNCQKLAIKYYNEIWNGHLQNTEMWILKQKLAKKGAKNY